MNTNVLFAVFKRNFVSYFANPTGYLFICVFVLMCSASAFWPPDFFNNNLANLDQLSWGIQILGFRFGFSIIMLVFIPSITMSIWSEERRQGTDELLLTIPAGDLEIVLGKYLAAVAIFSVALVFSLICNFAVLKWLGDPDVGLFLGTYFGYWLIGLAMLAIGMSASFLTSNLTVGYILGVLFNVPLVFASAAEVLFGPKSAAPLKSFSIGEQFADFGHGLISLSGIIYFLAIVVVMLYLGMVLIGRRHWVTGRRGSSMGVHYALRFLALAVIAIVGTIIFQRHDVRLDVTAEQLSSLAPQTKEMLANLKLQHSVQIDAFISPDVPEAYVQTRLNLLTILREFQAMSKGMIRVTVHNTEPLSDEAGLAEKRFGIEPKRVPTRQHGMMSFDNIFLAVAVTGGLEKVILPFIDRGTAVEYELIRSLGTVTQEKRKRVGVLATDAQVFGRFNPMNPGSGGNWTIIDELQKQYDVVQVNPSQPISEKYDVLLAVQPSSMGPEEMNNFVSAVENGQPTAIFEDPLPYFSSVPGTIMPRRAPGGMEAMLMGSRPQPKGDIRYLWNLLGVDFMANDVVWQNYNPYKKAGFFPKEFVFVDKDEDKDHVEPFGTEDNISLGLQQVLFPFPGAVGKLNASPMKFTPLANTGKKTGTVRVAEVMQMSPFGPRELNEDRRQIPTFGEYTLAAEIEGKIKPVPLAKPVPPEREKDAKKADQSKTGDSKEDEKNKAEEEKKPAQPKEIDLHVVLVADIDMLSDAFFQLREMGESQENELNFQFDNVTFILNALDKLAGDQRFIEIRKRRPRHHTLTRIEKETQAAQDEVAKAHEKYLSDIQKAEEDERKVVEEKVKELQSQQNADTMQLLIQVQMIQNDLNRKMEAKLDRIKKDKKQEYDKIETDLNTKKQQYQKQYKIWALILPPIPPLLVAIAVFSLRRKREREGVAKSRLR
ncbi:MAG: Gldg family protein [Thermoguttaceae bacterium]|jgi:ABC-2 type transport system permease protein